LLALASLDLACRDRRPGFSPTFTAIAFDDGSLQWLGISDLIAEPERPSSSPYGYVTAVRTGVTRDTRPNSEVDGTIREIDDKCRTGRMRHRQIRRLDAPDHLGRPISWPQWE
jgi:hypothetical protein